MIKKIIRVAVFIDGRNFYHSTRNIRKKGKDVNFRELIKKLVGDRELTTVFYYNALLDKEHNLEKYKEHNEFLDDLRKIPKFKVILCDVRKLRNKEGGFSYEVKGDDVHLAHDLLMGAVDDLYDVAIILSGDADFIPVIKTIKKRYKKRVGNGFFRSSSSYKLRKECDFSINLNRLIYLISKK